MEWPMTLPLHTFNSFENNYRCTQKQGVEKEEKGRSSDPTNISEREREREREIGYDCECGGDGVDFSPQTRDVLGGYRRSDSSQSRRSGPSRKI